MGNISAEQHSRIRTVLSNQRLLSVLLAIEILLVAASIFDHGLHGDEAWLGEQAYFKAKDGYVHSNFFKGFNLQDERILVYHRLFISTASVLFDTLGFGLSTLRIIPIVSGMLVMLLLWYCCKKLYKMTLAEASAVLLIFLMIPQAFYFIKIARPEMTVTLFGFASFVILIHYMRSQEWKYVLLAGVCAGTAMMTHLNGAIFIGTGIVMLAIHRKFFHAIGFGLAAALVLSPYIVDVAANFELFKLQMTNPYVASKTQTGILAPLINLSREHQRLFRKPEIILPMLLFLVSLILTWKNASPNRKILRSYCIVLMLLFGMLVEDKTVKYSTYLAPFWAIVIVDALPALVTKRTLWKVTFGILAGGFVLFSLYYQTQDIANKDRYVELNRAIGSHMPQGAWCVAPLNFMFDEIEHVNIISNELVRLETRNQPTADNLAAFCDRKGASYLVFNKHGERIDDLSDLKTNRQHVLTLFDIVVENNDFTIFRRKPSGQSTQMH